MNKIVFVSFADKRFLPSLNRIRSEAIKFNIFDQIYALDESSFSIEYHKKYKSRFRYRGFGYWMWKSQVIKDVFESLDHNDILFYADSGCYLNFKGLKRFQEYIQFVKQNEMGLLIFEQNLKEKNYTKSDVFSFFGILGNKKFTHSNQIWAGSFMLRKTNIAIDFINQWHDVCHNHFYLINDKPSIVPNFNTFIEHRHDQSIFSVLSKLYKPIVLSNNENYPLDKDWITMESMPIWAKRSKEMSSLSKIIHRIKYPLRKVILYFEKRD
jgi:hypothetical protein